MRMDVRDRSREDLVFRSQELSAQAMAGASSMYRVRSGARQWGFCWRRAAKPHQALVERYMMDVSKGRGVESPFGRVN
jgi:hypothetical protein